MSRTCNINLQGLNQLDACGNNLSGVRALWVANKNDVEAINAVLAATVTDFASLVTLDTSGLTTDHAIACVSGKGFAGVYCADDMGELKYATQGTITGCKSLKATLDIYHPGFKRVALGALAYFNNQEAIIVVKLNNGEIHLLGDLDRGAKLQDGMESTSGKASEDDNGVNFIWEYNCPAPRIFDEGWDPKDATTGLPIVTEQTVDDTEGDGD